MVETRVHNDFKKWLDSSQKLISVGSDLINLNLLAKFDLNIIPLILLAFSKLL